MEPRGKALWILLGVLACAPRLVEASTEVAYLHPDALHQALEPAFRAVYGYGQQTWEWRTGARSWIWPGFLAGPFWVAKSVGASGPGQGMGPSIWLARGLAVVIDVACVMLAARIAAHAAGRWAAICTVLVMSLLPGQVVIGAQPLIDVPAAACLLWACERAFACDRIDPRRAVWLGVALGATTALRIQLLPAVAAVLIALAWVVRPRRKLDRGSWLRIAIGFGAVVAASGALDWATWGSPFHSTLEYLRFNLDEGQTAMGVMPASRYWDHFWVSMGLAAPLILGLAIVGAWRRRALALVFLAVLVPHQLVPYKVWRFLHPAVVMLLLLAVLGAFAVVAALNERDRRLGAVAVAFFGVWLVVGSVRSSLRERIWETTWLYNQGGEDAVTMSRGLNRAYLELGRRPHLAGVVQTVLPYNAAPGLALLGHDVPTVHPIGSDVSPTAVGVADHWIVRETHEGTPLPESAREWVDPGSGVAIYRAPPRGRINP